jgi:hypothetical protein
MSGDLVGVEGLDAGIGFRGWIGKRAVISIDGLLHRVGICFQICEPFRRNAGDLKVGSNLTAAG